MKNKNETFLVIGGTGKTGHRVVERLAERNLLVRIGSRAGEPAFDWQDPTTWEAVLQDMTHLYVTFYPDLAVPGATDAIRAFTDLAVKSGVQRLVLLSGRGEEEAQKCEQIVQQSGLEWTIVRASWFNQNFSESFLHELILSGDIYLPVDDVGEPFVDAEDIADVVVAALTEEGHAEQIYELTGARLLTFAEAIAEIAKATGRQIQYTPIPHEVFVSEMEAQGVPEDAIWLMSYLFTTVLDGRNSNLTNDIQRVLGRQPRGFNEYVQQTAASGIWQAEAAPA